MNIEAPFVTNRYAPPRPVGDFALHWHGEHDETPIQDWLVDQILPRKGKGLMPGQWGLYKTFVALDLAGAVITEGLFAGHAVKRQGGVLFIAAEGQSEVRVRLEGLARDRIASAKPAIKIDPSELPFAWIEACPRLTQDDAAAQIGKIVDAVSSAMRERFGLPLALIVLDTMMAAASFRDANDASEAARVMAVLADVAIRADAFVLAVDHFGKNVDTGTRNSSAKEDAADAVLALLAERDIAGKVSRPRLAIRKVRGAPTGEEIPFAVREVVVHENAGHDAVKTLVIDWEARAAPSPPNGAKTRKAKLPPSVTIALHAFEKALDEVGEAAPTSNHVPAGARVVTIDQWREYAVRIGISKGEARAQRKAFQVAAERLIADGIIAVWEPYAWRNPAEP